MPLPYLVQYINKITVAQRSLVTSHQISGLYGETAFKTVQSLINSHIRFSKSNDLRRGLQSVFSDLMRYTKEQVNILPSINVIVPDLLYIDDKKPEVKALHFKPRPWKRQSGLEDINKALDQQKLA